jgi:hypothetical protein
MTTDISTAAAVAADLLEQLPAGRVLFGRSSDPGRRIWNGAVKHVPALRVPGITG